MASTVETQRLISLSLGKIARSRGQRGGINLHKNLLVASVLNKARTAFMMENYSYQISQHRPQVISPPSSTQPSSASASVLVASSTEKCEGNSLTQQTPAPTCQTTHSNESRSTPSSTQHTSSELLTSAVSVECTDNKMEDANPAPCVNDKENISPLSSKPIPNSVSDPSSRCHSNSGDQHIEAANHLAQTVQSEIYNCQQQSLCNNKNTTYTTLCNKQTPSLITCSPGILKRRRDNSNSILSSETEESPACKKLCVSFCELSNGSDSDSDNEEYMQTSESPQISNLVSIFNSGFSGLCMSSSSSPSSIDYQQSDDSTSSSISHQWSTSENQSLYCSAQVERISAISSAIVLSA